MRGIAAKQLGVVRELFGTAGSATPEEISANVASFEEFIDKRTDRQRVHGVRIP